MPAEPTAQPWDHFEGWSEQQRQLPLPVAQMSDALGVKRDTFERWAKTGRVPAFQVGKRWVCTPAAVIEDVTRDRDIFAKADTSVVYWRLRVKLRGDAARQLAEKPSPKMQRRSPGLVEPRAITPSVLGGDVTPPIVDASGLAQILGCSTQTIYRMAKADDIPSLRVGSRLRFEVERVLAALREPVDLWKQPGRSWAAKQRQRKG